LLLRRGQEVELVFFDDEEPGRWEGVLQAVRELLPFHPEESLRLWRFPYRRVLEDLRAKAPPRALCLYCKALMFSLAEDLLSRLKAVCLATGEIVGEQASQTASALVFTASGGPLLRPVAGLNKEDVFRFLREAGINPPSSLPVCPFAPPRPRTRPPKKPFLKRRFLQKWSRSFLFQEITVKRDGLCT
jgi:thiamine biosynthesis protein ThiI